MVMLTWSIRLGEAAALPAIAVSLVVSPHVESPLPSHLAMDAVDWEVSSYHV